MRSTSSAPGTLMPPGIETREYSSNGRLSTTTTSAPPRKSWSSSAAAIEGVRSTCSTNSPNALLGTLTPENSSSPAVGPCVDAAARGSTGRCSRSGSESWRHVRRGRRRRRTARCGSLRRGTSRAIRISSRLKGSERACSRWPCEKISSSRRSRIASSAPSASMPATSRALALRAVVGARAASFKERIHVARCGVIRFTLPVSRSKLSRLMRSRLVPVTRMKRELSG